MNGCLRFKIKDTHQIYKNASDNLAEAQAAATRDNIFNDPIKGDLYKTAFSDKYNLGYLEYKVDLTINSAPLSDQMLAHSKANDSDLAAYFILNKKSSRDRIFTKDFRVGYSRNVNLEYPDRYNVDKPPTKRDQDTEVKFLEELNQRFDENTTGEVHLFTRLVPCLSCDISIVAFLTKFKNISLYIYFMEGSSDCSDKTNLIFKNDVD